MTTLATVDRKRTPIAVGAVVVLAALAIVTVKAVRDSGGHAFVRSGLFPDGPLADGTATSIQQAAQMVAFPVYRPQTSLASDSTITGVWVRSTWSPEVYIEYASGVTTIVRRQAYTTTPTDWYRAQIADGTPGVITELDGVPAFEVPGDAQGDSASVSLVHDGTTITVIGNGDTYSSELAALVDSALRSTSATG